MANRTHLLLALGAVLAGAACIFAPGRTAMAAGPTIAVAPASASAVVGGDVTLDFTVDAVGAPGLGGYLIVLRWDPAVLSLTSLADSGWVTGGGIIVFCSPPTIDNATGLASMDCTPILAFGAGVTTASTRSLAQAVFSAKAEGTTSIDLTESNLLNPSNAAIAATLANGTVNVTAAPTVTSVPATATAAATDTPAASATAEVTATVQATPSPGTPAAVATSNIASNSTNAAGATLSNVGAPRAGSGDGSEGTGRTAWWIIGAAAAAIAVTAGGGAAYGWRRSRPGGGRQGRN